MGFESKVLAIVDKTLSDVEAGFCFHTLYVTCNARQAAKLETALLDANVGGVQVNPQIFTGEFSFDFV